MRKFIGTLIFAALCTPAFANMPPKEFDHECGHIEKHRVAYGKAWAMCDKLSKKLTGEGYDVSKMQIDGRALYGCYIGGTDVIVYSYDPTGKDPKMESNTYRHERAHRCGWPKNHPNARP